MQEITIIMPIETLSEANIKSHWSVRMMRARKQRRAAYYLCRESIGTAVNDIGNDKIKIQLIRCGMKKMDDDNLRVALKAVRDGICDWIKIDDGSDRLIWEYSQNLGYKKRHLIVKISS